MAEVRDPNAFVIGPLTHMGGKYGVRDSAHTCFYSFHETVDEAAIEAARISGQRWIGVWDDKFWTGEQGAVCMTYIVKFRRLFNAEELEERVRTELDYDLLERLARAPMLVTDKTCVKFLGWQGPTHLESINRLKAERFERLGLIRASGDGHVEATELGRDTVRAARYVESQGRPTKLPE